jgi:hypothetical protein
VLVPVSGLRATCAALVFARSDMQTRSTAARSSPPRARCRASSETDGKTNAAPVIVSCRCSFHQRADDTKGSAYRDRVALCGSVYAAHSRGRGGAGAYPGGGGEAARSAPRDPKIGELDRLELRSVPAGAARGGLFWKVNMQKIALSYAVDHSTISRLKARQAVTFGGLSVFRTSDG